jgi:hypothetical protein
MINWFEEFSRYYNYQVIKRIFPLSSPFISLLFYHSTAIALTSEVVITSSTLAKYPVLTGKDNYTK